MIPIWVSRALVTRPDCIIRLHAQNLWWRPALRSKPQTFASSLSTAAMSLLLSALLGCRLTGNTELSTWTDSFSEDLIPRFVKLHPRASLHMPALAEKQRGVRTRKHMERKGAPCSWHWGLNRAAQSPSGSSQQFWILCWDSDQACRPHPHRRRKQGDFWILVLLDLTCI